MALELVIVTDLQRFKLFSIKKESLGRESLELLESVDNLEVHQRLSEKVSDQYGHFQGSGSSGVNASGAGENHNLVAEGERRRIKEIVKQISEALQKHKHDSWYFCAPKAINNQIVELLNSKLKENMKINLHADLTKIPDDQLLKHFSS